MAIRTEDDAVAYIGHWFEALHGCVEAGVRDYYDFYKANAYIHRPTTRRSLIRDHIVHRLRALATDEKGIQTVNRHGTTFFGLASRYLAKVNKLNERMAIALNDTTHALDFQGNEPQISLGDDFERTTALYLGYVQNQSDPLNPQVFIVCPNGAGQPAWARELKREAGAIVIERPVPSDDFADEENLVEVPSEESEEKDEK